MRPPSQSHLRKVEIIRRLNAGDKGTDIATDLDVTRQYVSFVKRAMETTSQEDVLSRDRRGRPRNREFTLRESETLRAHLAAGQLPDGTAKPELSEYNVKEWFRGEHGRTLTVHQLRKFCMEEGMKLARATEAEMIAYGNYEEYPTEVRVERKPRRGRPPKGSAPRPPQQLTQEDIEEMAKSNAEITARLKAQRAAKKVPQRRPAPRLQRNDPCPFDAKKKFKRCCGANGSTWCSRQVEEQTLLNPIGD